MKAMTTGEKFDLIRYHGQSLASIGHSITQPLRRDILESAQRIIEIAKTIPKAEFGIEE